MTDKELRKLSRLELLEMLLEMSKENENLNKKLVQLKEENKAAKSAESLSVAATQMNAALQYINSITDSLNGTSKSAGKGNTHNSHPANNRKQSSASDVGLYCRILAFYAGNDYALDIMPEDLRNDVRSRLKDILTKKSN